MAAQHGRYWITGRQSEHHEENAQENKDHWDGQEHSSNDVSGEVPHMSLRWVRAGHRPGSWPKIIYLTLCIGP
jgi:hypothetical protein